MLTSRHQDEAPRSEPARRSASLRASSGQAAGATPPPTLNSDEIAAVTDIGEWVLVTSNPYLRARPWSYS